MAEFGKLIDKPRCIIESRCTNESECTSFLNLALWIKTWLSQSGIMDQNMQRVKKNVPFLFRRSTAICVVRADLTLASDKRTNRQSVVLLENVEKM